MIRASDLLGCELRTESGERLGHVHDLRAERTDHDWRLTGLVLGRRGISARLVGTGPDALIDGEVIGWEAVSRLEVGSIVVRDTSVPRGNFARHGKAASISPWRR